MGQQRTDPIRQAIASGEFDWATVLWSSYVNEIIDEINRGTCTQACMEETTELLEWSRSVVLCDRAHGQNQLSTIWVASQYGPGDSSADSFFRTSL